MEKQNSISIYSETYHQKINTNSNDIQEEARTGEE
jgi:hypothetical protein